MSATCTVTTAVNGACGAVAVWSNGTFAECAKHAADPGSMAGAHARHDRADARVGTSVTVHRHGKDYTGTVTRVTRTGVVWARVTYDNGTTKEVRV